MTAESQQFMLDMAEIIDEFGETFTFSRGSKKLASITGAYGKIRNNNIIPTDPSVTVSNERSICISAKTKYVPEVADVVQDSVKNIYQVTEITASRYQGQNIVFMLTVS